MPLMTQAVMLSQKRNRLPDSVHSSCSLKFVCEAMLLCSCALMIAYIYFNCAPNTSIRSWHEFSKRMNKTSDQVHISDTSKWQPLNGTLLCMVNAKQNNEQLSAVQRTWLNNCDNSQIFTHEPLHTAHSVFYRSIFAQLKDVQETDFWELIYGFVYAQTQISNHFHWYLNTQIDSYVFVSRLKWHLQRLDHEKPIAIATENKGLTLLSHAAIDFLANKLYSHDELCPFSEKPIEGFKKCFESIGVKVFDERHLKLQVLKYDSLKWANNLSESTVAHNNLVVVTECQSQAMHLLKFLTEERHLHNLRMPSSLANCSCN